LNILKKSTLILALAICSSITAISGCGQKGPLYLPVKPIQASTPKPAPTPISSAASPDEQTANPQTQK
jgi:predicted small lipoprotein YifL